MRHSDSVYKVREFNRFYTSVLGLLDRHILDSSFSLTEARVLYELCEAGQSVANTISVKLGIDKSYLSRILVKFEKLGLILKQVSSFDARAQDILMTDKGIRCMQELNEKSNTQIRRLLFSLSDAECGVVQSAMETIQKHLTKARAMCIRPFTMADINFVIADQIKLYEREYGFISAEWENYVATGVQTFADHFDGAKDCMYILEHNGVRSGCIAITHRDRQTAQLRFFFISSTARGQGFGNRLMDLAVAFCREMQYEKVFLWTFSKLDAARYLYQKHGFQITATKENGEWGEPVLEERWELSLH